MATTSIRKAGLHHNCIFIAHHATCASVRGLSWHTHIINLEVPYVHRLDGIHTHTLTMARLTWEQVAGEMVRTARSTRGNTGTRAGPNGAIGRITFLPN